MTKLETLAAEVAIVTPIKRNRWGHSAYVPWSLVEDIRAALAEQGIDWIALHARARLLQAERKLANVGVRGGPN